MIPTRQEKENDREVTVTLKGIEFMGDNVRDKLKYCGKGVRIHPLAKIWMPEVVELDDGCQICDLVFIWGGVRTKIGKQSQMTWHTLIEGTGETIIGDRVLIGPSTVIVTGLYDHRAGLRMIDHLPDGQTKLIKGKVVIEDDASISAGCVVLPNVTIGEGAVVGANSLVKEDLAPWGIYAGSPAKKVGERQRPAF